VKAFLPAVGATLIALAFASLAAPFASAQAGAFQCMAVAVVPGSSHATIYVTQMMPGDQSQRIALTNAWSAYVRGAYPQQNFSTTTCNPGSADPAVQQRVLATEQSAWQRSGMQVVVVNWQPGAKHQDSASNSNTNPYADAGPPKDAAAKDAPPADAKDAAPPPDTGPPPRASYCYSDDKKPPIYFSDAFDTAEMPNPKAWANAFNKMIAAKYMYKGIVTCKDSDTIFNAQGAIRDQKDTLTGKETIDTDWTYEPPAPGSPEAAAADAAPAPATPPKKKSTTPKPPPPQN
jgi:hypothetical protein